MFFRISTTNKVVIGPKHLVRWSFESTQLPMFVMYTVLVTQLSKVSLMVIRTYIALNLDARKNLRSQLNGHTALQCNRHEQLDRELPWFISTTGTTRTYLV
jgi:hypothetical protein